MPLSDPNIGLLKAVVRRLDRYSDKFVFLGGCVVGLLITDPASPDVRPTKDVDGLIEAITYTEYVEAEKMLEKLGFFRSEGPICRWEIDGFLFDMLPQKGNIAGLENRWLELVPTNYREYELSEGSRIKVIDPVLFLGAKIEAFLSRGQNDFLSTHDLEDIVTLINGRGELVDEVESADLELRKYIADVFSAWLKERRFLEAIPGHLNPDVGRVELVLNRFKAMAKFPRVFV